MSLCLDTHLEDRLQEESEKRVSRHPITILDDARTPPPPRSIPSYKLLGRSDRDKFSYSALHYRLRRAASWRIFVKEFSDRVKDAPILCLGLSNMTWAVEDLLAEMYAQPTCKPYCLVLLAEDPILNNISFRRLAESRTRLVAVRSSLGELMTAAVRADRIGYTPQLPIGDVDVSPFDSLYPCDEIALVVNRQLETATSSAEKERLLDLLFSPEIASWDPFVHDLDFRRSSEVGYLELIRNQFDSVQEQYTYSAVVIHGRAASGKTVLLKRMAYELAKAGRFVVWLRPSSLGESPQTIRYFLDSVSRSKEFRGQRLIFFIDDPVRFINLQVKDIANAARAADVQVMLVAGLRTADWKTRDPVDILGSFSLGAEECLSDDLDDDEWRAFAPYLVTLGIAIDEETAASKMCGVKTYHAQDTLSALYWLLPQTKAMITSSVRNEFFRLGDNTWMLDVVEKTKEHSTTLLKSAYEMVAVADHFRAPLPIEILVHALAVDYETWHDASSNDGPLWGLLYAEDSEESQTTCFRTRNDIVTRILIEAINGGVFSHAGELRILSRLLGACTGSQLAYRDFCVRVLVSNDALDKFEYQEGLQLFDLAMTSLPHPDRTLLHHKGLWIKNKGHDPVLASKFLEEALRTSVYPYAKRGELDEHIYTSLAATNLDAIDSGILPFREGKMVVLNHLDRARSPKIFNAKAVHVQANLILRLVDKESRDSVDYYPLVNKAVSEVDRALLILRNPLKEHRSESDIDLLVEVKERVFLKVADIEEMKSDAERLWDEHASQEGFVLVARKHLSVALASNKGQHFRKAFEYCQLKINTVRRKNRLLRPPFLRSPFISIIGG